MSSRSTIQRQLTFWSEASPARTCPPPERAPASDARTRSGNTWYHFQRLIGEVRPQAVVVENVASGARRWLPTIVRDLRGAGYRPHAVPVGAIHVGAPHRRLRVFVVALAHGRGHGREGERCGGLLDGEWAARGDDADERATAERSGRALPDPERAELRKQPGGGRGPHGPGAGLAGVDGAARVGDAASYGRGPGVHDGARRDRARSGGLAELGEGSGRSPQPLLGLHPHRLPFDVAGHRWPAGRGEAQHDWEPPRTIPQGVKSPERPAKLRACGNVAVPQCALVAGRVLVHLARSSRV